MKFIFKKEYCCWLQLAWLVIQVSFFGVFRLFCIQREMFHHYSMCVYIILVNYNTLASLHIHIIICYAMDILQLGHIKSTLLCSCLKIKNHLVIITSFKNPALEHSNSIKVTRNAQKRPRSWIQNKTWKKAPARSLRVAMCVLSEIMFSSIDWINVTIFGCKDFIIWLEYSTTSIGFITFPLSWLFHNMNKQSQLPLGRSLLYLHIFGKTRHKFW